MMARHGELTLVAPIKTLTLRWVLFGAVLVVVPGAPRHLMAQAAPGPLAQPHAQGPNVQRAPTPKPPEITPRTTLAGAWKLNPDDSDDPHLFAAYLEKYPGGAFAVIAQARLEALRSGDGR